MSDFDTDVLIVGAGPTGLTMAVELARRGVPCRIVDQAPHAATESRALGVHARTMEVFDLMGVLPRFLDTGHKAHGVRMISGGHDLVHVRLDEVDSAYPFVLIIPQSETERLLTERLTGLGVAVDRSVTLSTFTQDDPGVTATVNRAGVDETVCCRWIVGCDGAHSAVRHTLGLTFTGAPYPEEFALADVHLKWGLSDQELAVFVAEPGLAAFFPMGGDLWRVVVSSPAPSEAGGAGSDHAVRATDISLDEIISLVKARVDIPFEISDPVWTARFHVHRRIVDRMRVGRAFLAGDAADIHSPAGGQGMNTGIQSAHNLAWKLAVVDKGLAPESILDSYHAERHPVEEDVLRGTDFLTKMVTSRSKLTHWMREALAPIVSRQDFVQRRVTANVSEVAVGYRHSPIVEDHPVTDSGLHAGEHAPDFRVFPVLAGTEPVDGNGGVGVARLLDPLKYTLLVLSGPVVERPSSSNEPGNETPGSEGFGHLFPSFSGVGGASMFPAVPGVPLGRSGAQDGLQHIVAAGKTVSERFGDSVLCHLIVRDTDQTYGFDWPCDTWIDRDAALHERYGVSGPSLTLVRPDGYIAFRSGPADAERLLTYLDRMTVR